MLFVNIEPISPGGGVIPLDILLASRNVPQAIGALNYQENAEILLPTALVFPLPIWATVNGQRISNDTAISLPMNIDNNFGTFMLFPDAASENGNTLIFVNNSCLLYTSPSPRD